MAKQCGPYFITGCRDNLCFYQMDGQHYVRIRSSLSRKRVMKDPAFKATMQYAALLGAASKIASQLYRALPAAKKMHGLYRQLTGQVMQLLKQGNTPEMIFQLLQQPAKQPRKQKKHAKAVNSQQYADKVIANAFNCCMLETVTDTLYALPEAPA